MLCAAAALLIMPANPWWQWKRTFNHCHQAPQTPSQFHNVKGACIKDTNQKQQAQAYQISISTMQAGSALLPAAPKQNHAQDAHTPSKKAQIEKVFSSFLAHARVDDTRSNPAPHTMSSVSGIHAIPVIGPCTRTQDGIICLVAAGPCKTWEWIGLKDQPASHVHVAYGHVCWLTTRTRYWIIPGL